MFDKQELLKGITKPEVKLLFAKVLDQAYLCIKNRETVFTNFLDPNTFSNIINILEKKCEIEFSYFGGSCECERKIIGFYPEYSVIDIKDFPIKAIKIKTSLRFSEKLSHRDYLGSIMGLGIDRGKIGDILVFSDYTICFAKSEVADYIERNLDKVSRTKVTTQMLNFENIEKPDDIVKEKNVTVPSMRLDAVLSSTFNISRGKSLDLIKSEKIFLNWTLAMSQSKSVDEGDIISARGLGRVKILSINGKTKKERISITFNKFI